ncbi:MAG TPA: ABC transporter ATP-binding protein [Acidimicrobiales bacterium]|nr:ABC transporter ATP-binding protein [Acidimicrobiales bacterium]
MAEPILVVDDLTVSFATRKGHAQAVRGLSYSLAPGESLAIVGESGSGKSVSALALLGLLPKSARVSGEARFQGRDLISMPSSQLRQVRGNQIAMIFQDPMTAFNPVFTIGAQIAEAIRIHRPEVSKKDAMGEAEALLKQVGVPEAARRVRQYPHEYSGGMRQRAMIAMAIANQPTLLIADEPTTALDVTIQAQVMEVLAEAQEATGSAMILITHDLGLVAGVADRVIVMYGGMVFEQSDTRTVFYDSLNPYTRGLLQSIPQLTDDEGTRLEPIPGSPPSILTMPAGCAFSPRCLHRTEVCLERPAALAEVSPGHWSRCHHVDTLVALDAAESGEGART